MVFAAQVFLTVGTIAISHVKTFMYSWMLLGLGVNAS
jgi:hypothetical protein